MKEKRKTRRQKLKIFTEAALLTAALGLFFFLLFNILFSQSVAPLYFQLINENKNAVLGFLKKIKPLPEFKSEWKKYEAVYGKTIRNDVFRQEIEQKQMIQKLEQMLAKNPKARDVLYSLFLLTGDQKYLQQAKAVDPSIGNIVIK
jgi:hypothetical protein